MAPAATADSAAEAGADEAPEADTEEKAEVGISGRRLAARACAASCDETGQAAAQTCLSEQGDGARSLCEERGATATYQCMYERTVHASVKTYLQKSRSKSVGHVWNTTSISVRSFAIPHRQVRV